MKRVWTRVIAVAADCAERGNALNESAARDIVLGICEDEQTTPPEDALRYLTWALARRSAQWPAMGD